MSAFIDNSQRAKWSINKYFTARQSASAIMAGRLGHDGGGSEGPAGRMRLRPAEAGGELGQFLSNGLSWTSANDKK